MIKIHTDGSTLNNKKSGLAFIIEKDGVVQENCISYPEGNSAQMEILAVVEAINSCPDELDIIIYSDHQLTVDALNGRINFWAENGWLKENGYPVPHKSYYKLLYSVIIDRGFSIKGHWLKGHRDLGLNSRVNYLAKQSAIRQKTFLSKPFDTIFNKKVAKGS